tara:strand:+ start:192 stop:737 length:546 start_codon:yes stop_codon:yes gene_type:complete
MKHLLITILIGLMALAGKAQNEATASKVGFAINSSISGEIYPIRLVPSITYLKNKSQIELGFGIHPFIRKDQHIFSGEFNYKYFPNGTEKKFNLYLIANFSYIHNPRKTFYPSTYNYFFLNGGYGFQLSPFKNAYMGTNMTVGTFTYSKQSEIPYKSFIKKDFFDEFGFNLAFQFNVGYRF